MDQETLFTASKWQILKLLSEQPLSPIELAARSNTSVANISQQLRLLEMAGLVKSERIPNREKGQPRILYSLAGNHSFLIAATNDFVEKKLLKLSSYNKAILRIWFYGKPELHYFLEKAFWHIEQHLDKVDGIAVDQRAEDPVTLVLFSRDQGLRDKMKPLVIKNPAGTARQVQFVIAHPDKLDKQFAKASLYAIYDPSNICSSLEKGQEAKKG
jgi:DNA-binding transcriptional ArsR family regulator